MQAPLEKTKKTYHNSQTQFICQSLPFSYSPSHCIGLGWWSGLEQIQPMSCFLKSDTALSSIVGKKSINAWILTLPIESIKGSSNFMWLRPSKQTNSSSACVSRFILPHPASGELHYSMGLAKRTVCKQAPGLSKTAGPSEGAADFNLKQPCCCKQTVRSLSFLGFFCFNIHYTRVNSKNKVYWKRSMFKTSTKQQPEHNV